MDTNETSRDRSETVEAEFPRLVSTIRGKKTENHGSGNSLVNLCKQFVRASSFKPTDLEDTRGNLIAKCTK